MTLGTLRPGKPTDNGLIEAPNGRLWAGGLDEHWFLTLSDAREELETGREEYNGERPHGSPEDMTPEEFARRGGNLHSSGSGQSPSVAANDAPAERRRLRLTG